MASHTLARIQLPLPGWPPDLRSTGMNLSVWAKNWGLVNIPTTCFSLPLCSPRCHLALHEVNCTLSDRFRGPHNAHCKPSWIQFGLRDAEITALTWTTHLRPLDSLPLPAGGFYFSVFLDWSFNLALSSSRWLQSHRRLLITTQIPVNYQTSSSVFAT